MVSLVHVLSVVAPILALIFAIIRLLSQVMMTLDMIRQLWSKIESAFADTGGLSEFLTSSVVSTERTAPTPLDKGASGSGHGASP